MCRKSSLLIAMLVIVLAASAAPAATYYVATDGSDNDDGSSAYPWATLQYAVDTIAAGDTIIVRQGTYVGCRIEESGTAAAPKVLKVDTGASVLLNAPSAVARHTGILEVEKYDYVVSYWEIDGFEVAGSDGTYRCIDLRGTSHITVKNCEAYEAYATGIFAAFSDYVLIQDNVSYDNGEHGFYVNNSADNGAIVGNTSYGNAANGIHMNGDASMGGDGIMSYWDVDQNICYSNVSNGINCDGITDSRFRNNLIYNTGSKGFSLYGIDGAVTSRDDLLLNNTVVNPDGSYYAVFIHRNKKKKGDPVGMRLYNNILYHYSTATNRGSICVHDSAFSDFDSDYNVVMEYFGINDNRSRDTFAEWQERGYDTNSIQAADTALFTDPANDDYTLKTGSPAIDAGTTLTDVTDDIDGVSRPQGLAYDIGCYEAQ